MPPVLADRKAEVAAAAGRMSPRGGLTGHSSFSCRAGSIQGPADETYPNCVNGLPYLRDKDSLPTDSVQFALNETRSSILDTTELIAKVPSQPRQFAVTIAVRSWWLPFHRIRLTG